MSKVCLASPKSEANQLSCENTELASANASLKSCGVPASPNCSLYLQKRQGGRSHSSCEALSVTRFCVLKKAEEMHRPGAQNLTEIPWGWVLYRVMQQRCNS